MPPGREVTLPGSDASVVRNGFISLAQFRGLIEVSRFCQSYRKRIHFERLKPGLAIVDTQTPGRSWAGAEENPKAPRLRYALITRLLPASRQGPRLFAAGLTRFGTQAALDFLSQPDDCNDVARQLPRGWPHRNVQLVLRVNIVAGSHQPAALLASHVW